MKVSSADEASLVEAGILLSRGRLVAFPTETVFGLGCDASSEDAVERLYRVKGRARGNPLIVHVSSMEEAERWGVLCGRARLLARRFWAGGLTLVVPYRGEGFAPRGVVTDMGSIALRVPSHGVALSLLRAFGGGIAAPSANRSGCVMAFCRFSARCFFVRLRLRGAAVSPKGAWQSVDRRCFEKEEAER